MKSTKQREVWLRGPLENVPSLLQPVAHALLQAKEEVERLMEDFPDGLLWQKPAGVASPGFHLKHLKGVLDRLFTYAKGEQLNTEQLLYLSGEGEEPTTNFATQRLVDSFNEQVDKAIQQLKLTDEIILTENRSVGRLQLPSTTVGLLFHAAEHAMRHVGQLIVTVKVLRTRTH